MQIKIAKTIQAIDTGTNPLVKKIMDRSQQLDRAFALQTIGQTQFTWHGRRPKPSATANGCTRKTNLDLLSWLVELHKRSAEIALLDYDNQLPWKARTGEQRIGNQKPHGQIIDLISHQKHLSFSVLIKDMSILKSGAGEPSLGADRTYMIADHCGNWSPGWHGFDWDKTDDELSYLNRRSLLVDGKVQFSDYLHQNRRQSIYGAPYLLLKLLWQRIEDEIAFYESELKRLEKLGVVPYVEPAKVTHECLAVGDSRSAEVPVFTMQVNGPPFVGEYTAVSADAVGYHLAKQSLRFLKYKLRPMVQFVVRADEVAFYRFGLEQGFVSSWVKGTDWTYDMSQRAQVMQLGADLSISYKKDVTEMRLAA